VSASFVILTVFINHVAQFTQQRLKQNRKKPSYALKESYICSKTVSDRSMSVCFSMVSSSFLQCISFFRFVKPNCSNVSSSGGGGGGGVARIGWVFKNFVPKC
jgi:hypothetical protein